MTTLLEIEILEWAVKFDHHRGIIIDGDLSRTEFGHQPKLPFQ